MIVSTCASVVAIACGLGLFATVRVNHEPLTRLQASNPPPQLVSGYGVPAPATDGSPAPFGVRFPVNAPPARGAAVAVPASKRDLDEAEPPQPGATEPAAMAPVLSDHATAATTPPDAAAAAEPAPVISRDLEQQTNKAGADAVALQTQRDQTPAASADQVVKPAPEDLATAASGKTVNAAPENPPPAAAKTTAKISEGNRPARARTRTKVARKAMSRLAKRRKVVEPTPSTFAVRTGQNFSSTGYSSTPAYQSVPQISAPTAAVSVQQPQGSKKRRAVVKRVRPPKKSAQQSTSTQQTSSSSFADGAGTG